MFFKGNVLINPVNTQGVMGKGLALEFKNRFPNNFKLYYKKCQEGFNIGEILVVNELDKIIINFPTKEHWRNLSKMSYIHKGLKTLVKELKLPIYEGKLIHIPCLGCGLGGLDPQEVLNTIDLYLRDINRNIKYF